MSFIYTYWHSRLGKKALLLAAIIVLCNLAFVVSTLVMQMCFESQLKQEPAAHLVVISVAKISTALQDAASASLAPKQSEKFSKKNYMILFAECATQITELRMVLKDRPSDTAILDGVNMSVNQASGLAKRINAPDYDQKSSFSKFQHFSYATELVDLTDSMSRQLDKLQGKYYAIESSGNSLTNQAHNSLINNTIFLAVIANALITIAIFLNFIRNIGGRITAISNTAGSAAGHADAKPIKFTNDEIEDVNVAFRQLAFQINSAKSRARLILKNAANFICMIDQKGLIVSVSEASARILAHNPDQLIGRRLNSILTAQAAEIVNGALKNPGENLTTTFECRVATTPRGHREFRFALRTSHNHDCICVGYDISEENKVLAQINASQERHKHILDALPLTVLGLNAAGKINSVNQAGSLMSQYSAEELLGQALETFLADSNYPRSQSSSKEDTYTGSGAKLRQRLKRKDGSSIAVEVHICTCSEKELGTSTTLACLRDLSIEVEIESAKRDFINMIGHDLRSPLTSLHMALIVMAQEGDHQEVAEGQVILENLIVLTTDFLYLGKLEAGEEQLFATKKSFLSVFNTIIGALSDSPLTRALSLNISKPAQDFDLKTDDLRLAEIITHLLTALNTSGSPETSFWLDFACEKSELVVQVAGAVDSGSASMIAAEDASALRNRLSLDLARALVNLHGGTLDAYQLEERSGYRIGIDTELPC